MFAGSELASLWTCIAAVSTVLIFLYTVGTWNYDTYRKRRMKYLPPPLPFIGNLGPVFTGSETFTDLVMRLYEKAKPYKYLGLFEFTTPFIMITDPDLIKAIMVRYFDNFTAHRRVVYQDLDPLIGRSIATMRGDEWRTTKHFMSPVFTAIKVKTQFPLLKECCDYTIEHLEKRLKQHQSDHPNDATMDVNLKELFTKFSMNVAASVVYGTKVNSYEDPDNAFTSHGMRILDDILEEKSIILGGYLLFPKLMHMLGIPLLEREINEFFMNTAMDAIAFRKQQNGVRNDVIQYLLHMKEKEGTSDIELWGMAFMFFTASFEAISTTLFATCHNLACHPEVQSRAIEEIDRVMAENESNELSFDDLKKLTYLDMVLSEIMRLYPILMTLDRVCEKTCSFSVSPTEPPLCIKTGEIIQIPTYAIHRDPEYWDEPEKFDPERFNEENIKNIKPYMYLPFGYGPRICLGQRVAQAQLKLLMAMMLSRFTFCVTENTGVPLTMKKKYFAWVPEKGYTVGFMPRNK